jgi:transglutaminase superfamily protein
MYDELSEPEYCILTMYSVLYRHLGLTLNLDCHDPAKPYDGNDSRNQFIHAVLMAAHPATCCTAPVIFAAIGRRFGFPIKLVKTREHIFCRWDGRDGIRFNIEATDRGYYRNSDDHYRRWPKPVDEESIRLGGFLRSMTPRQELSVFLNLRGAVFLENLQLSEAVKAFYFACQADPSEHFHSNHWKIASLIQRAQCERPNADPRSWRTPSPRTEAEAIIYPTACRTLNRIVSNRQNTFQETLTPV